MTEAELAILRRAYAKQILFGVNIVDRRLEEALAVSQKALELDPLSPALHVQVGYRYSMIRQEDLAIKKFHDALELDPQLPLAHWYLSISYLLTGKMDEAIREIETAAQLMGHNQYYTALLGFTYARAGRISEARRILEELQQHAAREDVPASDFAIISLALDEIDKGFDLFEKAIDESEDVLASVYGIRLLEPWHSHPRYHALRRKMNLADLPEVPVP